MWADGVAAWVPAFGVMWTTHPRNLRGEALRVAGDVTCGTHRFWNRVNISHDSLTASAETSASGTGS